MPVQTSVQLFTVNAALEADLDGTLAAIAARGFTAVEPYDFVRRAEPLAASLTAHGLAAPTGHAFLASESFVLPDGSGTTVPVPSPEEVFAAAKTLGMTTVIDPYTAPDRWTSPTTSRLTSADRRIISTGVSSGSVGGRLPPWRSDSRYTSTSSSSSEPK